MLLATGWNGTLRDCAYAREPFRITRLAVAVYVLILLVIAKLLGFGLDYYGFRLEHRYHLSNQGLRAGSGMRRKSCWSAWSSTGCMVEVFYFMLRQFPQHWWLLAWAVFLGLFVLLAQLAPVVLFPIFYKFEPWRMMSLKHRLVRLGERAGTRVRGVYKWKLSEKSKKANAALTGLGDTRRIILADTLLDNYSPDEIEAVLAHELGSPRSQTHSERASPYRRASRCFGFWAANWALHYAVDRLHMFDELSDFANLPLLVLVVTVISFLALPALNAYSRFNERQADRYAFESIASVDPFISSMNKLAEQNLAERTPSRFVEWFFHSHPAISRRLQAAQAWAKAQG